MQKHDLTLYESCDILLVVHACCVGRIWGFKPWLARDGMGGNYGVVKAQIEWPLTLIF